MGTGWSWAQDRDSHLSLVNTVMKLQVPKMGGIS